MTHLRPMMLRVMTKSLLVTGLLFCLSSFPAFPSSDSPKPRKFPAQSAFADSDRLSGTALAAEAGSMKNSQPEREAIFDTKDRSLANSHFTWGAEIGTSIDIAGYDLSTFDLDFNIGYKNRLFNSLGVSGGVHRNFHHGTYYVPFTAMARVNLNPANPWGFLQLNVGYSFNTVGDTKSAGAFTFSTGIGFRLAYSRRFSSHVSVGYSYMRLAKTQQAMLDKRRTNVDLIHVRLGINF